MYFTSNLTYCVSITITVYGPMNKNLALKKFQNNVLLKWRLLSACNKVLQTPNINFEAEFLITPQLDYFDRICAFY